MTIQCDIHWSKHIFQVSKVAFKCVNVLKQCKIYFTSSDVLTILSRIPDLWWNTTPIYGPTLQEPILENWKFVQESVKALICDIGLSNKLDSLKQRRNMGCISLFHYNGMWSAEIWELIPILIHLYATFAHLPYCRCVEQTTIRSLSRH